MTPTAPRHPVWTWTKVALGLVVIDLALFRWGLFWAAVPTVRGDNPTTWGLLYTAVRHLEYDRPAVAPAYLIGSSVLFLGVSDERVNAALEARDLPVRATMLTTFGASATDLAMLAATALEHHPWLVLYGAATRDFAKDAPLDSPTSRVLLDYSIDLPAAPAAGAEERLARWLRRWWKLYRYRIFVRSRLEDLWHAIVRRTAAPVLPPPPAPAPGEPELPPEAYERFHFARITPAGWAAWLHWKETRRWDDFVGWMHASGNQALTAYATQRLDTYGPDDNPQAASLEWMLERVRAGGARAVVVLFPENPAFRDPAAHEYYDPALSAAWAARLAAEAARAGARFVDLRDALPAEDFHDFIHPNLAGMRTLSARLADIVAEEWAAREGRGSAAP